MVGEDVYIDVNLKNTRGGEKFKKNTSGIIVMTEGPNVNPLWSP